jgi:hypothetical protein
MPTVAEQNPIAGAGAYGTWLIAQRGTVPSDLDLEF